MFSTIGISYLHGNDLAPNLQGFVTFTPTRSAVLVEVNVTGLPAPSPNNPTGFFAFHLHSGDDCNYPSFSGAEGHYNPNNTPHPDHAGDFPMLLSTKSQSAYTAFLTTRFTVEEIIGRTLVIHAGIDDYSSQPSGNAGARIACGVVCMYR